MTIRLVFACTAFVFATVSQAPAENICSGFGPQSPRDLTDPVGFNTQWFSFAPEPQRLNLCNIHFHNNAEHKAVGFAIFAGSGPHGGYQCTKHRH